MAAACESAATEKEKEAEGAFGGVAGEGAVGADAAERRVVDAATRGDAGKTAERPPGKSAVKAGASFASAAGVVAPETRERAEEKIVGGAREGEKGQGQGRTGEGRRRRRRKDEGRGGERRRRRRRAQGMGQAGDGVDDATRARGERAHPAAARKAAPLVPASKAAVNGVAAAAAKLSVSAPRSSRRPRGRAGVRPRFKQTTDAEPPAAPAPDEGELNARRRGADEGELEARRRGADEGELNARRRGADEGELNASESAPKRRAAPASQSDAVFRRRRDARDVHAARGSRLSSSLDSPFPSDPFGPSFVFKNRSSSAALRRAPAGRGAGRRRGGRGRRRRRHECV